MLHLHTFEKIFWLRLHWLISDYFSKSSKNGLKGLKGIGVLKKKSFLFHLKFLFFCFQLKPPIMNWIMMRNDLNSKCILFSMYEKYILCTFGLHFRTKTAYWLPSLTLVCWMQAFWAVIFSQLWSFEKSFALRPIKIDLNKKFFLKQKTFQPFKVH